MQFTKQGVIAAIILIISTVASIIGILLGAPELVAKYSHKLPEVMKDPTLWWCVTIMGIGIALALLVLAPWKRRPTEKRNFNPEFIESWLLQQIDSAVTAIGLIAAASTPAETDRTMLKIVEHDFPAFLQSAMSKAERAKYETVLDEARESGAQPIELFRVATQYFIGIMARETLRRVKREQQSSLSGS